MRQRETADPRSVLIDVLGAEGVSIDVVLREMTLAGLPLPATSRAVTEMILAGEAELTADHKLVPAHAALALTVLQTAG